MAEKKQKEQKVRTIYKVLVVLGCVLFVVLMIVSSMGTSWLSAFKAVKPGDTVTIDYTIRDNNGNPLVTSNQQVYLQQARENKTVLFSQQLVFTANKSTVKPLIALPVYSGYSSWSGTFALFGGEHDAISEGIVGMKVNEQKTIAIPFTSSMTETWTTDQIKSQGLNVSEVHIGDLLAMAVSNSDTLAVNATESSYSVRLGEVTSKSSESITINFGYPAIDVQVISIGDSSGSTSLGTFIV